MSQAEVIGVLWFIIYLKSIAILSEGKAVTFRLLRKFLAFVMHLNVVNLSLFI